MPCVLTLLSSQNFAFGLNNANCPPVSIPICLPPNTLVYTRDANGCESYFCTNLQNPLNPFIPSGFSPNSGNGTLFFPDSGVLVSPFCSNVQFADLTPFIPTGFNSSGRAGTLFFPDSGVFVGSICGNSNVLDNSLSNIIPIILINNGSAGTLFFPDSGVTLCVN